MAYLVEHQNYMTLNTPNTTINGGNTIEYCIVFRAYILVAILFWQNFVYVPHFIQHSLEHEEVNFLTFLQIIILNVLLIFEQREICKFCNTSMLITFWCI